MKKLLFVLCCQVLLLGSAMTSAAPTTIGEGETISSMLASQQGKHLTLKLASGQELSGEVAAVNAHVVYLKELAGREFFDALVNIDDIEAIVLRAK